MTLYGTPAKEEDYTLDQLGNWPGFVKKSSSVTILNQTRTHNAANELTEIDSSTSHVAEDAAGNMTKIPKPTSWSAHFDLKFDAWNRLVEVKDGSTVVTANEFDGLGRRIRRVIIPSAVNIAYDYYYNEQWQLLEERKDADTHPLAQYVWHPHYIDALAVRYWDQDTDGNLAEANDGAHYYLHDANFNVTSVMNSSSTVLERYHYSPYGEVTFMDSSFGIRASSLIGNNHLYTGRERDGETGLQLNRHRFYHAQMGRWVNRDPIGYKGSEWNLYEFDSGKPLIILDPQGTGWYRDFWDWCFGNVPDPPPSLPKPPTPPPPPPKPPTPPPPCIRNPNGKPGNIPNPWPKREWGNDNYRACFVGCLSCNSPPNHPNNPKEGCRECCSLCADAGIDKSKIPPRAAPNLQHDLNLCNSSCEAIK